MTMFRTARCGVALCVAVVSAAIGLDALAGEDGRVPFISFVGLRSTLTDADREAPAVATAAATANEPVADADLPFGFDMLDQLPNLFGEIAPLPETPVPADNPQSPEKIMLGKLLFFDKRLSRDESMSCATCHDPEKGWADGRPRSIGFGGEELGRHSPTVLNTAFNGPQFWDGRAHGLEAQAIGPIMAAGEMNMPSEIEVLRRIAEAPEYEGRFEAVFDQAVSLDNIGKAIASFERTAVTRNAPFDRYVDGDKAALTDQQKRGLILFMTTASCTACHNGSNFTDNKFHSLGVAQQGPLSEDMGRMAVTNDGADNNAFKTPTLRNIEQTGPYMHDGSLATLTDVVQFYNRGGGDSPHRSELIQPLDLSDQQVADIVEFLKTLTGDVPEVAAPDGEYFGT